MTRGYGDETNRDRWRDDDRERSSYTRDRDEDRGFFERAGDQLRSWFGEDDDRDYGRDYRREPSWDRNQGISQEGMRGSPWDREGNRIQRPSRDQNRSGSGFSDHNRDQGFSRMGRGGYGQTNSNVWSSSSDRNRSRSSGFGGFRDEGDFRSQHRRNHPQSWGEANRGENESLGYGEFRGTLGGFGNQTFGSSEHDHYRNWRDRQLSALDRDYDDYCREREQQFNQDFDSWRRNRQSNKPLSESNAPGGELGTASNAGVGTTTASMTGTAGVGSAIGSGTGSGGSIQSDTSRATESADAGSPTGGRTGARSRT